MNTKMKLLSLALVGLCGFAGSAMAACPAGPTTADGGAVGCKVFGAGHDRIEAAKTIALEAFDPGAGYTGA